MRFFLFLMFIGLCGAGISSPRAADSVSWFNHGTAPIEVLAGSPRELSSADCRSCHQTVYRDWNLSRHSVSWTNPIFQEGFLTEPQDRCIFCHAPMTAQLAALRTKSTDALPHEGVNCAVCHVRDRQVFTGGTTGDSLAHAFGNEPLLKKAEFCAGCHQFNFNRQVNGESILESTPVQNTYTEWLAYQKSGGTKTCQNCHMPEGRHLFRGAHDLAFLKSSLSVKIRRVGPEIELCLKPKAVGHSFPTGDLFRHVSFEVQRDGEKEFRELYVIGKRYKLEIDEATGNAAQILDSDTALAPSEVRKVRLKIVGPFRYRLRYHYTSEKNERISRLGSDSLIETFFSGYYSL